MVAVMAPVVVVVVIVVVPMAFMEAPAFRVMVPVAVVPVGTGVRRAIPAAGDPDVAAATPAPVAIDPGVSGTGHGRTCLIAQGWRRGAADLNAEADLGYGGTR